MSLEHHLIAPLTDINFRDGLYMEVFHQAGEKLPDAGRSGVIHPGGLQAVLSLLLLNRSGLRIVPADQQLIAGFQLTTGRLRLWFGLVGWNGLRLGGRLRLLRGGGDIPVRDLIAHADLGGVPAEAQKTGFGPLQHLHRDVVPVQTQLEQGGGDGVLLRAAGGLDPLSHPQTPSFLSSSSSGSSTSICSTSTSTSSVSAGS